MLDAQQLQISLLLFLACLIFLARQIRDHEGAADAIKSVAMGCEFVSPGPWKSGPYGKSSKLCARGESVEVLRNHMRVHCRGMEACIAAEFGSNVAVGLFPDQDLFVINPIVVETESAEMIVCKTDNGGVTQVSSPTTVKYLDEKFSAAERKFYNRGACQINAMVAEMRGERFM